MNYYSLDKKGEPNTNASVSKRILELDGLRAFAVIFVVIYHTIIWSGLIHNSNSFFILLLGILGEAGVYMFFIISGFIITSLLLREYATPKGISLISFYQRRFFRIIPPFAIYLFALALLCKINYIFVKPIDFLWSSLFLGNWGLLESPHTSSGWFLGHTWSLSVEEQYYLILPPVIIIILKFRPMRTNILLIILFTICLFSLKIAREAAIHINPILINLTSLYSFKYIIAGVLFALHKNIVHKILRGKSLLFPICLICFILICPYLGIIPGIFSIFLSAAEAICYGFLVLWFVVNPEKCAALRWKWIQWVGSCSYSIYLWQQLFTGKANFYNGWTISKLPFSIIAILACASLSYYFVELPSIRLGRFVSAKR